MDTEHTHAQIIQALGLSEVPQDERDRLLFVMGEVVHRGVMRKAWGALDEEHQDKLNERMEASLADPDNDAKRLAVQAFLQEQVPDLEKYVTEEIEALKEAQERAHAELAA
jgi:hypothetical protein